MDCEKYDGYTWTRQARWSASDLLLGEGTRAIINVLMYTKNERDDLTSNQLRILRKIIEEEYP